MQGQRLGLSGHYRQPNRKANNSMATPYSANFTTDNVALVLVDHQVGTINWAGELDSAGREQLKTWARAIARFAKGAGIPIVLTSSLETEAQGPLLPEFKDIMPDEYDKRIKRTGVINAWEDPNFASAVRATGKKNLLMSGLTTDVCLVPPALSAKAEGFQVIALFDSSGACTIQAAENSRYRLNQAGIEVWGTPSVITHLLKNYKNPASGAFFDAFDKEAIYAMLGKGNVR
jgi:nicotinamidase-related amidase